MKFFLLTIAVLLFIPVFAGAQFYYVVDSFDTLPDTAAGGGYGWYADGAGTYQSPYIKASISTDNKLEGAGAMTVDWQNQRYDQWGGWIGLNYFDPDSGVIDEFGLYDTLSLWFYNEVPQSKKDVEFRVILYDHGPGTSWDEFEVWISHHLILDDGPGWQHMMIPMIDVGADAQGQHDEGFQYLLVRQVDEEDAECH